MTHEVHPMLKSADTWGPCGCGCGVHGTLLVKADKNGKRHVRKCDTSVCYFCRGRKNKTNGRARQKRAQDRLGVPKGAFGTGHEENWADPLFSWEVKSGKQVGPSFRQWQRCEAQIIANRPDHGGQHKAPGVVLMPEGWRDGLVMVRLSTWRELIRPALEAHWGGA